MLWRSHRHTSVSFQLPDRRRRSPTATRTEDASRRVKLQAVHIRPQTCTNNVGIQIQRHLYRHRHRQMALKIMGKILQGPSSLSRHLPSSKTRVILQRFQTRAQLSWTVGHIGLQPALRVKSIYQLPPRTFMKLLLLISNGQMVSNSLITDLPMFGPMNSTTKDFNVWTTFGIVSRTFYLMGRGLD